MFPHLALEGVDDELEVDRLDALDALLDHVVPVLVLDALEHVTLQLGNDELKRNFELFKPIFYSKTLI